jgi:hypothetical protein
MDFPQQRNGNIFAGLLGFVISACVVGCADHDRPSEYGRQRPPVDQLDSRDRGLQSADVVQASDKIVTQLLASPELRDSKKQWMLVVSGVEDHTHDRQFRSVDYGIFLDRLRSNISEQGRGLITLIENRDRFYDIRNRELEGGGRGERDEFGQGEGTSGRGAQGAISPDLGLYLTAVDMPNRGTTYYVMSYRVVNLHTRVQVFDGRYEVKVAR